MTLENRHCSHAHCGCVRSGKASASGSNVAFSEAENWQRAHREYSCGLHSEIFPNAVL
jgi:hypothetical protein